MVVCRSSSHESSRRASKTILRVVTSDSDGAQSISNQMSRNICIFGALVLGFLTAGGLRAQNAGGVLLTTVSNPTLAASERFGSSVAALGSDRVLVGASSAGNGGAGVGAAYLVAVDGRLLSSSCASLSASLLPLPTAQQRVHCQSSPPLPTQKHSLSVIQKRWRGATLPCR